MKPLIILILVFSAFNVSAKKKLTVEELKDLKSRPLLVVLVPEEDPRAYQKHAGKPTFNDALKKAPEAWKSNSEIKVIDSKEWDKMTVADKKKWTVLTLAGMDAHFMQYRLPMTGKNIEDNIMYECLFYITLNRADNEKYKLRGSANCDYEIPLPVSTNDITGVTANELQAWLKVIQNHIEASIAAGELLAFHEFGAAQHKLNCAQLCSIGNSNDDHSQCRSASGSSSKKIR